MLLKITCFTTNTKTGKIYQNEPKIFQMTIKYTKLPQNIPNDRKTDQRAI
jgi:hypothetical protein